VHAEAARLEGTVLPLLERGCTVVVDHFGRPDPTLGVSDPGFQWLLSMAGQPNLFVKLSAPYRNWDQKTEAGRNSARDAARLLLEAYTPARLMWGSDWPHTQFETSQSYGQSLEDIKALLPDESTRIAVLSETARRFYRFRDSAPEIKKQHS
ncbi:MAG TPA: amidohydrolase family protein, partial [Burkholderiaceae bacterium]|nr:amidohydrolase family protein [Burkholderiaceae bacterium]